MSSIYHAPASAIDHAAAALRARAVASHRTGPGCMFAAALTLALAALVPTASAATLTVNSTSDIDPAGDSNPGDGVCEDERAGTRCTLRAAIQEANALEGLDTIRFSVAGTIAVLGGQLPAVSDAIILDGRSAPGYTNGGSLAASPPVVTIDGALLPGTPWGLTVRNVDAAISDVLALSVVNFAGGGIRAMSNAHELLLQGCYIGVRPDGSAAGNGIGLSLATNANLVGQFGLPGFGSGIGNVISSNDGIGLLMLGSGTLVRGNRIGTGASGSGDRGNGDDGIQLLGSGNRIGDATASGGNVITHNAGDGIRLFGDDNIIEGNDIGGAGLSTFGNDEHGIAVFGDDNRIGGETALARNMVRGNGFANILLGSDASPSDRTQVINNAIRASDGQGILVHTGMRNRIVDNDIGDNDGDGIRVHAATTTAIARNRIGFVLGGGGAVFASPNLGNGINASGGASLVGFDMVGEVLSAGGNTVGFSGLDGIVLNGNASRVSLNHVGFTAAGDAMPNAVNGIRLLGGPGSANLLATGNFVGMNGASGIAVHSEGARVCSNHVGTNAAGHDLGNGSDGIWLTGESNEIGDGGSCAGNILGFNAGFGVRVHGAANVLAGNHIGVAPDGSAVGNASSGILLVGAEAVDNTISSNALGYNAGDGIQAGTAGTGNRFEHNRFVANDGLPIDLGASGPEPNDALDADTGPNLLQNHPVVEFANVLGGVLQVTWRVDSSSLHSSYPLAVDFYMDGGDGMVQYLGRLAYATPFALQVGELPLPPGLSGGLLYAMATDAAGNSSELSAPRGVGLPAAVFADGFEQP